MVATTGGVDVLPGSLVANELCLVQRVQRFGQRVVVGVPFDPTEATVLHSARAAP